ncbi:Hsp20/alpha crystallin family protein [Megalodesulfovibrio paquesii]
MAASTTPPGFPGFPGLHPRLATPNREPHRIIPDTDIIELEDGFHIFLDMPGIDKESLRISLNGSELHVSARTRFDLDKAMRGSKTLAHMEFGGGEYLAAFTISDDVDRERIRATVHNGVIDLHLPRSTRQTTRIAILRG